MPELVINLHMHTVYSDGFGTHADIAKAAGMDFPDCLVHGRKGGDALRQKGTIGIHAIRAGDIVGKHSVIYATDGESVTLSHNATNRDAFAAGAIGAAEWIADKKPALYSMADVVKKEN